MSKSKKQQTTEEVYTQVVPVVSCSDEAQVNRIMHMCGIPRALTYNKLGSLKGWGLDWKKADKIVRTIMSPDQIGLPSKLWEWSVNDTMKAITAQQEAAKVWIIRLLWQKYPMQSNQKQRVQWLEANKKSSKDKALELFPKCEVERHRDRLFQLLYNDPTNDHWLHRQFRNQYLKGHTYVRNQIVYQSGGYSCNRVNRHSVRLEVAGLEPGKRITLVVRTRQIISGQIRLIRQMNGNLEVHCARRRVLTQLGGTPLRKIGIDKGYTEAFYTSEGTKIGESLGKHLTQKTKRITSQNRNRHRLRCYAQNNPQKSKTILENNLGYKVKSRRLEREKATIQNSIRRDLRRAISSPVQLYAEDLTQPIIGKKKSKAINRKLNQWIKGELQVSLEKIARETGSTLSVVNPAYTSQVDCQTGTLLGQRDGDRFIRYTGDVIQADNNAAINIRDRGTDPEITRYMKSGEVEMVLLIRTIRYLAFIGRSCSSALELGWLHPKFKTKALRLEAGYRPQG